MRARPSFHLSCVLLILAFCLPTEGRGQNVSLLRCGIAPLNEHCVVQLSRGQKTVVATFGINPSLSLAFPSELENRAFTISPSVCCVDTTQVASHKTGLATVKWSGEAVPETNVLLTVSTMLGGELRSDTIVLRPPDPIAPLDLVIPELENSHTYVWLRGEYLPIPVHLEFDSLKNPATGQLTPLTASECSKIKFTFQPLAEAKVTPDSGIARWVPSHHQPARSTCAVETRWKLAEAAGEHQLYLTLSGERVQRIPIRVSGVAREGPRLSAGYGYFRNARVSQSVRCQSAESHPRCATLDSLPGTVTVDGSRDGGQPYFGLELPVFMRYRVGRPVTRWLSEHTRVVVGTTFTRPEDNIFVGLALLPVLTSAAERSPFQLTAGVVGFRGFYTGMALDASTVIEPVLAALGIAGGE